jgi:hypothetical protein
MSDWLMRGHFQHLHFKAFSNDIKNTSRRGVLTFAIELRSCRSPGGLQAPTFESVSLILTLASKWGCDTETVLGLLFESHGTKNHLDVGGMERRKEYHMEEGGGFPQVWAVVSLMNPELAMARPSTKGVPKSELTNLLVAWMQVRVSN